MTDRPQHRQRRVGDAATQEQRAAGSLHDLRLQEVKYRRLADLTRDLVCVADRSGRLVEVNRAWEERLGYTRDELVQMSLGELSSGPQAASPPDVGATWVPGPDSDGQVVRVWAKNRSVLSAQVFISPLHDEQGHAERSFVVFREIPSSAKGLSSGLAALDAAAAATGAAVVLRDPWLRIVFESSLAAKWFGTLVGSTRPLGMSAEAASTHEQRLLEARQKAKPSHCLAPLVYLDGKIESSEVAVRPVLDEQGEVTGILEVIRRPYAREPAVPGSLPLLPGTVLSRVQHYSQEMNQPLSGIVGYSELLQKSVGQSDPAYRYVRKIYEQSERLANLVRRINESEPAGGQPPASNRPPRKPGRRKRSPWA